MKAMLESTLPKLKNGNVVKSKTIFDFEESQNLQIFISGRKKGSSHQTYRKGGEEVGEGLTDEQAILSVDQLGVEFISI